jgi:hypothetical protein
VERTQTQVIPPTLFERDKITDDLDNIGVVAYLLDNMFGNAHK